MKWRHKQFPAIANVLLLLNKGAGVVQGAAYHEISTWSRTDYMIGFIKYVMKQTACLFHWTSSM